jgi:glycerol transport system ATP-binding protein
MARIEFENLAHSYKTNPQQASDYALQKIELTWRDGGAYALLGPSGCGKTTLLNIISGLVRPSQGRVLFDGRDMTDLPTEKRNIAQVFQFPVIYDTMSVFDNLAFPLRNRGMKEPDTRKRVHEIAELLELSSDLKIRASGLSADIKQKISLGRGLVRSDVAAILFDEPLTVIDPNLKWLLRSKLKQIHQQLKLTLIYVTHDQIEALTFADSVVVMYDGAIVQVGTPQELFERPKHTFVGYFIGSPGMNLLDCRLEHDNAVVGGQQIKLEAGLAAKATSSGGELKIGIRPEFLGYANQAQPGAINAQIERIDDLGNYKIATAKLGNQTLKLKLEEDAQISSGAGWLVFPPERLMLYQNGRVVE